MSATPSAQYRLTIRVKLDDAPGNLARLTTAIGDAGGIVAAVDMVEMDGSSSLRDIVVDASGREHWERILAAIAQVAGVEVIDTTDRTFLLHVGGKIEQANKHPLKTRDDLSMLYTPGVARVCLAIQKDPRAAREFTSIDSTVAVVTNGTAVLGLGNIGPLAGLPVMEGKAALFADLVGLSAVPILLEDRQPEQVADLICRIHLSFGAIQLEDFAAPECFEIERLLRERLGKPVLHDDQHGTAVVALAALTNAARRAGRSWEESVIGQIGLGAAGLGIVRLLRAGGATRVLGADRNPAAVARLVALGGEGATPESIMQRADIVIATTGVKGLIKPDWVRPGQVILALSNPDPEIEPLTARERGAAFAADGKGINNVLAFPGLFKGALAARAARFTDAMLMAAARAIAEQAQDDALVPDPLDKSMHERVAAAVRQAAV